MFPFFSVIESIIEILKHGLFLCFKGDPGSDGPAGEPGPQVSHPDQFRFLGNCPPTPPLTQHFALSKK